MTDLELQLQRAQALALVGLMASSLAHDINNLLFVIGTSLDLIETEPGRVREYAGTMRSALVRMSALNCQLLTCAARSQSTDPELVDVSAVIAELWPMCQRLAGRAVTVTCAFDERPNRVRIGRGPFDQVLLNLVANARDAMPGGGTIAIRARRIESSDGTLVAVEVADEGVGIAPELLDHIFEPFFTTKERSTGSGLGLQTVKRVIEGAGGRVAVSSHPGQGSTFRLLLPIAADEEQAIV